MGEPVVRHLLDEESQLLLKAADLIEEKGWVRGDFKNAHGFCLIGALMEVDKGAIAFHTSLARKAWSRFYRAVKGSPMCWNDAPERTKEEVVAKLREVAYQAS